MTVSFSPDLWPFRDAGLVGFAGAFGSVSAAGGCLCSQRRRLAQFSPADEDAENQEIASLAAGRPGGPVADVCPVCGRTVMGI